MSKCVAAVCATTASPSSLSVTTLHYTTTWLYSLLKEHFQLQLEPTQIVQDTLPMLRFLITFAQSLLPHKWTFTGSSDEDWISLGATIEFPMSSFSTAFQISFIYYINSTRGIAQIANPKTPFELLFNHSLFIQQIFDGYLLGIQNRVSPP